MKEKSHVIEATLIRVDTVKNMKQYSSEANIFFRNIPNHITIEQIKTLFSPFGKVMSSKLVASENKSLGYGYVQFESKASAEECIKKANEFLLDGVSIKIERFVPRSGRENIKNNIYVKGFSKKASIEEITQKIEVLKQYK